MAKRDWNGRQVELLRDIQNVGATVLIRTGEEATITQVYRGVTLRTIDGREISRVADHDYRIIPVRPEVECVALYNASRILRCYIQKCTTRGEKTGLGLGNLPASFDDSEVSAVWSYIERIAEIMRTESGLSIDAPGARTWSEMPYPSIQDVESAVNVDDAAPAELPHSAGQI